MKVWDLLETGRVESKGLKVIGSMLIICGIGGGCSRPSFSYDSRPGTEVGHFRDVALDPRKDFVLGVENMHPVNFPEIQSQVMGALEAKGYRFVPSDQAELWLDVFTLAAGGSRHGNGNSNINGKPEGRGGAGGGRSGRGSHGSAMEGGKGSMGGRNPQQGGETPSRDISAPGGDLLIVVELVERASTEMVWTGVLELPMPKSASTTQTSSKEMIGIKVDQLLQPLPIRKKSAEER